jgi:5-methyltetrahydrofolate--homocysteine methyltransferase
MNTKPANEGYILLKDIPLTDIVPFIHWSFFFMAWRMSGKYEGIETVCSCGSCKMDWLLKFPATERAKAEEALSLYKDAQEMLRHFRENKVITINAAIGIYPAYSTGEDIVFNRDNQLITIPMLRQQQPSTDGYCYSLADFIKSEGDYAGVFATTVQGVEAFAESFEKKDDMYNSILVKTLSDRIAEATAEWLHYKVRTKYWAYAPEEKPDVDAMFKVKYKGIRPAIGYPSLPDQSIIFELDKLVDFRKTGITLTENGAMFPNASVCGLYFAHPLSKYFMIGKIDEAQLEDYASRKGKTAEEIRKWLIANL